MRRQNGVRERMLCLSEGLAGRWSALVRAFGVAEAFNAITLSFAMRRVKDEEFLRSSYGSMSFARNTENGYITIVQRSASRLFALRKPLNLHICSQPATYYPPHISQPQSSPTSVNPQPQTSTPPPPQHVPPSHPHQYKPSSPHAGEITHSSHTAAHAVNPADPSIETPPNSAHAAARTRSPPPPATSPGIPN